MNKRSGFVKLLWAATILVNAFVVTMAALVIVQDRERAVALAVLQTDNYSRILEQSLAGFIGKIDSTLLAVRDEVVRQRNGGAIERAELEAVLRRNDERLPEALGLRVVDAKGIIRYAVSGVRVANASIADRPQFIYLRDHAEDALVFSKPVLGRAALTWMITLNRRIDNPDGSFGGDVHVAVAVDRFIDMFARIDLGAHGNIGLWDDDTLIARYSRADAHGATTGATTPSANLRELLKAAPKEAVYHANSGVDGVARTYFFRRVGDYPLFLVVGLADQDYLAEWRTDTLRMIGLAGLFLIATLVPSWLAYRNWKRQRLDQEALDRQAADYTARLEGSRADAEAARQRSELILSSAGEGICGIDVDGRIVFVNPAARRMFGWADDEGIGVDFHADCHQGHGDGTPCPADDCPVLNTARDGKSRQVKDELYRRRDGSVFPVEFTVTAMRRDGQVAGAVTIFRDVTERKQLEERITRMALFDELTGLPNRAFLADALPRMAAAAQRRHEIVGLLYLDLDGFKAVNDALGHAAGDAVLSEVAARMKACLRAEDIVSRLGGDEFLVATLTAADTAKADCAALAERLIRALHEPVLLPQGVAQTGASIGIALLPESNYAIERCLQQADDAMYRAKKAGKGAYAVAEPGPAVTST